MIILNLNIDKKYRRRQNIGATKYWCRQKLTGWTKISRQQNSRVDKTHASTKFWRQQKSCMDENLASTKISRRQNSRVDKRRRRIPLLFGSAESTAADFSQTSLKISFVSQTMLIP